MLKGPYGYSSYRGRSKARTALTVVVVVLLVLLALAVAAFFLLQQYMVYTDDGQARLELPFLRPKTEAAAPAPSAAPSESPEITVVTGPSSELPGDPASSGAVLPSSEPIPVTNALWLLRAHLTENSYGREVQKAGANAVLFNLKADDGTLGYVSSLEQSIRWKTTASDGNLNTAIARLNDAELYTIARVSCFRDSQAPKSNTDLALKSASGNTWRDPTELRWMSAADQTARDYVLGVIRELADMGFDEILLENSGFPNRGELSRIQVGEKYDPEHLTEPVEEFYRQVRQALEGTGVRLSIAASEQVLAGESDGSGQTLDLLAKYADRVYLPVQAREAARTQTAIPADALVYMVPQGTAVDPGVSQLILR